MIFDYFMVYFHMLEWFSLFCFVFAWLLGFWLAILYIVFVFLQNC